LSQQDQADGRRKLPDGWDWANWSGKAEAHRFWNELDNRSFQAMRHRFMEIRAARGCGRMLDHTKNFYEGGIGKAKVKYPSPGCRAFHFQYGSTDYLSHFCMKADDHDKQISSANLARKEHLANAQKKRSK